MNSVWTFQDAKNKFSAVVDQSLMGEPQINDQWRICFVWTDNGAQQVEIVDYH